MDSITLGKKIAKLRKERKMTQIDLAERLHVSDSTISKWERGTSVPDIVTLKQMSEVFNVPVESLIDGNSITKRKDSLCKYLSLILSFIYTNIFKIIFFITFILLAIFFVNNYNSIKVYNIKTDDERIDIKESYFIESSEKDVLIINNITIHNIDYEIIAVKTKLYTVVNGDRVLLGQNDSLESITIKDFSFNNATDVLKEIKNNLYLVIDTIDINGQSHNYEIKFDVVKNIANNKLMYFTKKRETDNKETTDSNNLLTEIILLNNGFTKDEETGNYIREDKVKIVVDLENSKVIINKNTKSEIVYYVILYDQNYIHVRNYDVNRKVTNNYKYYYNSDDLQCYKGNCDSYKKDTEYALGIFNSIK